MKFGHVSNAQMNKETSDGPALRVSGGGLMAMLIKTPYGHVEVFHSTWYRDDDEPLFDGEGWYWWVYEPGCLPKPHGPFETEQEALEDTADECG